MIRQTVVFNQKNRVYRPQPARLESNRTLYKLSSTFPFVFFPDSIIVQEKEIRFSYRTFFSSRMDIPVFFEDIRTINVSSDLFFATLWVDLKTSETNPPPVKFLRKNQARRARRLITGLMVCQRSRIHLATLPLSEAITTVEKLAGEKL